MRNDVLSALLGFYAKTEKNYISKLQEASKAARDEKAITESIQKKGPEDTTQKRGSP